MSAPPLYKIANWHALFEPSESRRSSSPLKWIPVPTKTDGFGFGLLRQEKNNAELLAAWYLMLGIAAKQPIELRGTLMRDGQPLTAEDLELMTGFPAKIFTSAFVFFTQPRQGWLVKCDAQTVGTKMFSVEQKCSALNKNVPTQEERIGEDRTGQDMTGERNAAGAAQAIEAPSEMAETGQPDANAAKSSETGPKTDANWLDGLKTHAAYQGIDVAREYAKAQVWCENKRRVLTRARFINWLNRAERPMAGRSTMR